MPHVDKSPEEVLRIVTAIDALQALRDEQTILLSKLRSAILHEHVKVASGPPLYDIAKVGSYEEWLYNRLREQVAQGGVVCK